MAPSKKNLVLIIEKINLDIWFGMNSMSKSLFIFLRSAYSATGELSSKINFKTSGFFKLIIELMDALKPFFCLDNRTLSHNTPSPESLRIFFWNPRINQIKPV